mgnify:CR=1 FL=1|tara:strand:- start:172 stop:759 length:588 start_codon:yes stop_codon:yes gene_type:complete
MKTSLSLIGGRKIDSPKTDKTRPTTLMVRQALFNILNKKVENSNWLDLFSGSGAISCEAYNHGAKKIVAVEKNRITAELCKKNLFSLKDSQLRENDLKIICKDVLPWIKNHIGTKHLENKNLENIVFDYIYIDPPYKKNFYSNLLKDLFKSYFLTKKTTVICEHSKNEVISANHLWGIEDTRIYGQTKLTFLVKI